MWIQEAIKEEVELQRSSRNTQVEFPRDVAQFCGISMGETLFSLKFPRVNGKVANLKITGIFSRMPHFKLVFIIAARTTYNLFLIPS